MSKSNYKIEQVFNDNTSITFEKLFLNTINTYIANKESGLSEEKVVQVIE